MRIPRLLRNIGCITQPMLLQFKASMGFVALRREVLRLGEAHPFTCLCPDLRCVLCRAYIGFVYSCRCIAVPCQHGLHCPQGRHAALGGEESFHVPLPRSEVGTHQKQMRACRVAVNTVCQLGMMKVQASEKGCTYLSPTCTCLPRKSRIHMATPFTPLQLSVGWLARPSCSVVVGGFV